MALFPSNLLTFLIGFGASSDETFSIDVELTGSFDNLLDKAHYATVSARFCSSRSIAVGVAVYADVDAVCGLSSGVQRRRRPAQATNLRTSGRESGRLVGRSTGLMSWLHKRLRPWEGRWTLEESATEAGMGLWMLLLAAVAVGIVLATIVVFLILSYLFSVQSNVEQNRLLQHKSLWIDADTPIIAFFHPFCDGGGGGERVLWVSICELQKQYPNALYVIYCWDKVLSLSELLKKVDQNFGLTVDPQNIDFRALKTWNWLLPEKYKHFTLLGQSLGSIYVAWEAMTILLPDIFIDTTGFAFTYPLVKHIFHCKVIAYVHYPTITSSMVKHVEDRKENFNNNSNISNSIFLTKFKLFYYSLFAKLYSRCGLDAEKIMVNSTWTKNHIDSIWNLTTENQSQIVYPPSSNPKIENISLDKERERIILSIGQFRPEKNHKLQIQAFKKLIEKYDIKSNLKLIMLGGCRNDDDLQRIDQLQNLINETGYSKDNKNKLSIEIIKNAPYEELLNYLSKSLIGLHTMNDEHFGISIVEYMSAGLIAIAHNSAGPAGDILKPDDNGNIVGYLATTVDEYADKLNEALNLSKESRLDLVIRARERAKTKFSDQNFANKFVQNVIDIIPEENK